MIFFKSDWDYYPTAIVHKTTKNTSWIKHANLLKKMGIDNWYSHLALINPALEHVDPHDPNISVEDAERVLLECSDNIWYFLREVVRVPAKASANGSMLKLDRGNYALYFLTMNDIDVGYTQIRQTGKTLNSNILLQYLMIIKSRNTEFQWLTREGKLRAKTVQEMKDIRKGLPSYVQHVSKDDPDNTEGVGCTKHKNKITLHLPKASASDATGAGRGFTSPIIVIDESAFCKNIQHMYPSIMASANAASDEAKRAGYPTFKLLPCTAGNLDTPEGKFMYDIYHEAANWSETFIDSKDKEELQERIRTNSLGRRLLCYVEMNHRQLGYSDEWLHDKISTARGSVDETNRDFFNKWTSGSGSSPLDRLIREAISNSRMEPVWTELFNNSYQINWYISESEIQKRIGRNVKFVGGLDSSEGLGHDQITLVILDEETLETVGCCTVSGCSAVIEFSDFICTLMKKYSNLILIPERRSTGVIIIENLLIQLPLAGIDPFHRVFNKAINENKIRGYGSNGSEIQQFYNTPLGRRSNAGYQKFKAEFGYATSGSGEYSRSNLYLNTLQRLAQLAADTVRDKHLVNELMRLVVKDGRIDHAASGHDDHVISWLLAGWMLTISRNLSDYGILRPLSKSTTYHDKQRTITETKVERYDRNNQNLIKAKLDILLKKLSESSGDFESIILEKQIRFLSSQLQDVEKLPMSIDELLKQANEVRRTRKIATNNRWKR